MSKTGTDLVSQLAELYEFSLSIGQSLTFEKNAEAFFSSFAQRKNLTHISIWHQVNQTLQVKATYPKVILKPDTLTEANELYKVLADNPTHKIVLSKGSYKDLPEQLNTSKLWMYRFDTMHILFSFIDQSHAISGRESAQISTIFKKFILSCTACIAHENLRTEMEKRHEAERILFERESLFRFGANSLSEGIIATDPSGVITYVNRAMTPITGYRYDELFQADARKIFVAPDGNTAVMGVLLGKKTDADGGVYEGQLVHKTGSHYWVRIKASEFKNSEGEIIGTIASVLEVSERIKVLNELEENQKELQDLVDNMYEALVVFSEDGFLKKINKAGKNLLQIGNKAINRLHMTDLVHPDDLIKLNKYRELLKTKGYYSGYQGRLITGKGEIRHVEVNSTAIFEGNKYTGSRDILRDISQRIEAEKLQKNSQEQLKLIIDTALDAVISADIEGYVIDWNKNAERIFGYTRKEAIGQKLTELIIPPHYVDSHKKGWAHYRKTGEGPVLGKRIEISAINRSGEEFPVELSISPVKQGDDVILSAFVRDITERKTIESQKELLLTELEEANQELRDFAYIVSHDLKAPLRSIGSLSDWLHQDYSSVLDEQGNELLSLLNSRVSRMHNLIEGVLQYSKIGRLSDEKEALDVNELIKEVIDLLAPPEGYTIKLPNNFPIVKYDRIRLQQVFQNLLSNAIKYSNKDKGEITVGFKEDDAFYFFSITDNGIGISKSHYERIFQIFQTLQPKDQYESTGIGLSIVKRIVERNGGQITVESEVGVGSTFTFSIPKND